MLRLLDEKRSVNYLWDGECRPRRVAQMPSKARADLADRTRKKDAEQRVATLIHIVIGLLIDAVTALVISARLIGLV